MKITKKETGLLNCHSLLLCSIEKSPLPVVCSTVNTDDNNSLCYYQLKNA